MLKIVQKRAIFGHFWQKVAICGHFSVKTEFSRKIVYYESMRIRMLHLKNVFSLQIIRRIKLRSKNYENAIKINNAPTVRGFLVFSKPLDLKI